jgi:hypothetical protein
MCEVILISTEGEKFYIENLPICQYSASCSIAAIIEQPLNYSSQVIRDFADYMHHRDTINNYNIFNLITLSYDFTYTSLRNECMEYISHFIDDLIELYGLYDIVCQTYIHFTKEYPSYPRLMKYFASNCTKHTSSSDFLNMPFELLYHFVDAT